MFDIANEKRRRYFLLVPDQELVQSHTLHPFLKEGHKARGASIQHYFDDPGVHYLRKPYIRTEFRRTRQLLEVRTVVIVCTRTQFQCPEKAKAIHDLPYHALEATPGRSLDGILLFVQKNVTRQNP